MTKENIKAP